MKIARFALLALIVSAAGRGNLDADDQAVHENISDYSIRQPLEFRVAELTAQDTPPNGVSPSDTVPQQPQPMEMPAEMNVNEGADVVEPMDAGVGGALLDCCCFGPRWTVALDAVYLNRTTNDRVLQYDNTFGDAVGVVPEFDYEFGYRIGATFCRPCGDDIGVSYMSVDNWSGGTSGDGGPFEFGFEFFGIDLGDVEAFRNRYESDLDSLEINFRRCCGCFTLTYGFHYLSIDERLNIDQIYFLGFEEMISDTSNRLYGLQIGAEGRIYECCNFSVDMSGKVGGYLNDHEVYAYWSDAPAEFADSGQDFSVVGQASITARYQVRDCVSLRGGYQMMVITDVADAVSQLDSVDLFVDPTEGHIATDDVVYHGFFLGVEISR